MGKEQLQGIKWEGTRWTRGRNKLTLGWEYIKKGRPTED
jgi:hypothetical protein